MIIVSGKTYELRDRLKEMGGRWITRNKTWTFANLSSAHRAELQATVGLFVTDQSDDNLDDLEAWLDKRHGETNIFGDDKTWYNYFQGKNPTTYYGYSSIAEIIKTIKRIPQSVINQRDWRRNTAWSSNVEEWFGCADMDAALKLARHGWPDGVKMAEYILEKLTGRNAVQRRRRYSVAGGAVNIGRMLTGDPAHMIDRPKQPGKKVITFFAESTMSASIETENAIIRAAIIGAMVDMLEMNGFSCEIVSVDTNDHRSRPAYQITTALKAAGEPLNLNDLVFALGHPAFCRRMSLAIMAIDPDLREVWESGGMPVDAFNENNPTMPNEIYIKRIEHDMQNYIDEDAPLLQRIIQIWDLITDANLPITINREI